MDFAGKRILIAEDELALAETIKDMFLFFENFSRSKISILQTPEQTVQFLLREQPDITILDLGLGQGLSGLEILKTVKGRIPATCHIYVYSGSYELKDECLAAGVMGFYEKSVNFLNVIEDIKKLA